MNPDAKAGSGKNSRRRTPSVDAVVGGPVGGRGPDFKRRGRNKKSAIPGGGVGLVPGHLRYILIEATTNGNRINCLHIIHAILIHWP